MNTALRRQYWRLIYSRTFRALAIALVPCALVGGLYASHAHFIFALCAAGMLLIAWGWLAHLRSTGLRLPTLRTGRRAPRVPFIHQRFKTALPARPAFRKDFRDFDDDLTSAMAIDPTQFDDSDVQKARVYAYVACGALLILLSFVL